MAEPEPNSWKLTAAHPRWAYEFVSRVTRQTETLSFTVDMLAPTDFLRASTGLKVLRVTPDPRTVTGFIIREQITAVLTETQKNKKDPDAFYLAMDNAFRKGAKAVYDKLLLDEEAFTQIYGDYSNAPILVTQVVDKFKESLKGQDINPEERLERFIALRGAEIAHGLFQQIATEVVTKFGTARP